MIPHLENACDSPPIQVHREVKELSLLFDISEALSRNMDLREVMGPVLKAISEQMGMLRGTVTILNRETREIAIEEAYGLSTEAQARGRYKVGEGITGQVVQSGNPAVVLRISEEPQFLNRTRARRKNSDQPEPEMSFICVPIRLGNETIGALSADRLYREGNTCEDDLRLLAIIASMIAQAVRLRQSSREEYLALQEENLRLQQALGDRFKPANMIGNSHAVQRVFQLVQQVAASQATVLICGESGVGKELVAHAIHFNSPRHNQPFIKVNCAALPENLVESELFGHEKGAFTGAVASRKGRFELANGGSIFLDEIGDLTAATQVKLLRVLQEREFERVGGTGAIKTDVRVLAATSRQLETMIREGKFREDLYYRLNVFPIYVPPLRERKTDILLLADHFVEKYARVNHKDVRRISTPAIDMLTSYHWPGNVRELENCIERAVLLSTDDVIHGHHLPPSLQTAEFSGTMPSNQLQPALEALEKEMIVEALKTTHGNMAAAARSLGITERIMGLRVAKFGIQSERFKSRAAVANPSAP